MLKIDRLETHDRLLYLHKQQALNLSQGAEDCLRKNILSLALQQHSPYIYMFAHPRTADNGLDKRMLWQPRLTKPRVQTNSYLFRAESSGDVVEVCWMLPPKEMWLQYRKGQVTENDVVLWSIDQYLRKKEELEAPNSGDLSDEQASNIYFKVLREMNEEKMINKVWSKPDSSGESSVFSPVL